MANSAAAYNAHRASTPLPWEQAASDPPNDATTAATGASPPRQRVRHSFDIFADQLLALRDIALRRELRQGSRVRLGDLVQEALDAFITHETGQPSLHDAASMPGVSFTGNLGTR